MTAEEQQAVDRVVRELLDLQLRTGELTAMLLRLSTGQGPAGAPRRSHTAVAQVQGAAEAEPERVWTLDDFYARFPNMSRQTVRATVGRLCRDGLGLTYARRGRYQYLRPGAPARSRPRPTRSRA